MPRIFDCFPFFNELDLLEIRLNELSDVVDFFVLVEATKTHRGLPKPLYFERNKDRFAAFLPKIIHVIVDDLPDIDESEPSRWVRENHQRQAIIRGLETAGWRDWIIVTDVDEIPRATCVETIARRGRWATRYDFQMRLFWYFLNLEKRETWTHGTMARRGHLRDVNQFRLFGQPWITPRRQPKRMAKTIKYFRSPMRWKAVPDAGWHFTFMGGSAAVHLKLWNYSHATPDEHLSIEHAQARIDGAIRDPEFSVRSLDDSFPAFLLRNQARFASLLFTPDGPREPRILNAG